MSSKKRRAKKKKYRESSSSESESSEDHDKNYYGNNFHEAVRNTIIKHEGPRESLAATVVGFISTHETNLKNKWDLKERKKQDEKLRKKAGCCFTLFCCACFRKESSVVCKILGFLLFSGFVIRMIQGLIIYFTGGSINLNVTTQ